jgi:hypothetical protein
VLLDAVVNAAHETAITKSAAYDRMMAKFDLEKFPIKGGG